MKVFLTTVLALVALGFASSSAAAPLFGEKGSAFRDGTRALEVNAAYIHPIRFSRDKFYGANLAGHYYFADEVSLGVELQGYYVDQLRDDTVLGGANVLLRWHFLAHERYSLFVDGAMGVSYAADDVPETGLHFNYTPQGGGGATVKLRDDLHLLGGVRFIHLSNGNLKGRDENPSQDGVQYYVGVMFTF
jgi:hypothetical protein